MTGHDRKALLRAFYGLATLWIINGVFGLLRAAGPGALLPYIEIGLLLAYWAWVFIWWRNNRPRARLSQVKRDRREAKSALTNDEISKAVDREEAIARERNRRRKQRLQRSASAAGEKLSTIAFQLRYVAAGLAVAFAITGGLLAYQELNKTLERQEAEKTSELRRAETTVRVIGALAAWNARNNCLVSELNLRWADWYERNPETRSVRYFSESQLKWVTITKTLPLPQSLDDITWFIVNEIDKKPKSWPVSQSHFDPLVSEIKDDCTDRWPPPNGADESVMTPGFIEFTIAGVTSEEQRKYQWRNPFPQNPFGW